MRTKTEWPFHFWGRKRRDIGLVLFFLETIKRPTTNYIVANNILRLTLNVLIDPVYIRTNPSVHRISIPGTRSTRNPRGRATNNPLATLLTRQGTTTVAHTHATSLTPDTNHRLFIHNSTISLTTLCVAYHWDVGLFKGCCQYIIVRVDSPPSCLNVMKT